ncbi:hypothetical protein IMG5_064470 [Ichthyophthirius multifiliis]|uniref:DNA/RNA-binding protein Alba-like domain-containing protein n=1 Tax=Ichthyophthirius multifiliis TaxID=5932 RepID=G0QP62_ICHMU|nr:hypothetical protein IMG5_064470 [Ichthyophthirius multifiliis]EGR32992.1 hypothetical protein IMG5_064470 [Ichthyophthirius multifiliis]|eukprot:XP_004036978.1 hypothetical protein IMG5_064470 [Ichthyophthirius multifiliis]
MSEQQQNQRQQHNSSTINVSRTTTSRTIQTRIKGALNHHEKVTVSGIGSAVENVVQSVAELQQKKLVVIAKTTTNLANQQSQRQSHQLLVELTRGEEFKLGGNQQQEQN